MSSSGSDHAPAEDPPDAAPPVLPVEDLMVQLVQRANDIIGTQVRLRSLLEVNRAVVGELSVPKVLLRVVEGARDIAGARAAALGVLTADGGLEPLVQLGLAEAEVAATRSLLERQDRGARDPAPDPEPDPAPTGRTTLTVPVHAQGGLYGWLHVTGPAEQAFSAEDEDLVLALAATAGIAVANARLYEESRRRQEWLLASSQLSQRLLADDDGRAVWRQIVSTVHGLSEATLVSLVVPTEDEDLMEVVVAAGDGAESIEGRTYPARTSVARRAMEQGRAAVLQSSAEHHLRFLANPEEPVGPLMALPLQGEFGARGAVVVCRAVAQPPFSPVDISLAEDFAGQAAMALELSDARSAQHRVSALEDRERIARDLHDHVIQRLFATGLSLNSAARSAADPAVQERLRGTVGELDETIRQIRTSIFALKYSKPALTSLRATVLGVVEEAVPRLGVRPVSRFAGPVDSFADEELAGDVAAVLREWLAGLQHAGAQHVSVEVVTDGRTLDLVVTDDGPGDPAGTRRSGGPELVERAARYGGELVVHQPSGEGRRLRWSIPVT